MLLRPVLTRILVLALTPLLWTGCGGTKSEGSPLEVTDARIRAPVPGQSRTAGYFTARNVSDRTVVLTGARSPAAESVELHTTVRDGDVMRMRPLPEVVIAPGETVRFAPGGSHLMLFGVSELEDSVEITLEHGDTGETRVRFETITLGGG